MLPKKYAALIALGGVWAMVWRMAFKFSKRDHDDPDREWRERLDRLEDMLAFLINYTLETHAMITPQIQDALDRIRQTQSLAHANAEALKLQSTQIGTLTDKVTELQAKLDAGGTIGAEDLAAVAEIASDIDSVNTELQSAVPANTSTTGSAGGAVGSAIGGVGSGPAPAPADPAPVDATQQAADSAAAAAAKPLGS